MLLLDHGSNYREEMIATAFVIGITVTGSFLLLGRLHNTTGTVESEPGKVEVLGLQVDETAEVVEDYNTENESQEAKNQEVPNPSPSPTPTSIATVTPTPTPQPPLSQIPYGASQEFENDSYTINFSNPRLIVNTSRQFKIDVVIANKSVEEGLDNTIFGVISREGNILSTRAPLSLSEIQTIMPKQKLTFTASISLPESTEIEEIVFDPVVDTALTVNYQVGPTQ